MLLTLAEFSQIVGAELPDLRFDTSCGLFGEHDKELDLFLSLPTSEILERIAKKSSEALERAGAKIIEEAACNLSAGIENKVDDALAEDIALANPDFDVLDKEDSE